MFKELPPKAFDEGTLNLLLPNDPRTGEAVPECRTPAFARATGTVTSSSVKKVPQWPIPDALIAQMNATRIK